MSDNFVLLEKVNQINEKMDSLIKDNKDMKEDLHKFDKRIDRLEQRQQLHEENNKYIRDNLEKINHYIITEEAIDTTREKIWSKITKSKFFIPVIIIILSMLLELDIKELIKSIL